MKQITFTATIVLTLTIGIGCNLGTRASYLYAESGLIGTVDLRRGSDKHPGKTKATKKFHGELLSVQDQGLYMLIENRLVLIDYGIIKRTYFKGGYRAVFAPKRTAEHKRLYFTDPKREKLRLLSRYPQTISDALLQQLLEAHAQQELILVQ